GFLQGESGRLGHVLAGSVNQRERSGSYAEYVAAPAGEIVPKPAAFTLQEAAAYPTVSTAAWRYMVLAAGLKSGERVLIHGGAGGVGTVAVQLAKARGAYVITTALERNHDYVRGLGADEVIDYRSTRFEDVVKDVDVVVDTIGGDTLTRSGQVLRNGGRLVSMTAKVPESMCADGRILCPATPPWNVREGLEGVAPLIAAGKLQINIDGIYTLDSIVAAQQHNRSGNTRGKVVVDMQGDADIHVEGDGAATVRVPLQAYLDGHATGEPRHFRRAFAEDALLVGHKDGKYRQWPASEYIGQAASGRAPRDEAQRHRRIRSITVTGDVASAVVELDYPDMKASDHMSVLKYGDEWRIAVKAYDAHTPEARE
ncbi:MAG TPA: nuclear transport factor 2 family protein, partial [Tahibacter sp.]|nr:nuclear transport factor 2 family protein [Tahibacter sp.]